MNTLKHIYFLLIVAVIGSPLFAQVRTGQHAPEIALKTVDGKDIHLSDLKGKVVLVDFWASWCGPCRRNNPHLVKLYKKYHEKGLEIFGVSLDQDESQWKKAINHDGLSWIHVLDNRGGNENSAYVYGVDVIPSSFLLDKEGNIKAIDLEGSSLETEVKSLLKN